jgi:hypothetical protein
VIGGPRGGYRCGRKIQANQRELAATNLADGLLVRIASGNAADPASLRERPCSAPPAPGLRSVPGTNGGCGELANRPDAHASRGSRNHSHGGAWPLQLASSGGQVR